MLAHVSMQSQMYICELHWDVGLLLQSLLYMQDAEHANMLTNTRVDVKQGLALGPALPCPALPCPAPPRPAPARPAPPRPLSQ